VTRKIVMPFLVPKDILSHQNQPVINWK